MNDILEQFTNRPLASDGPVTCLFRTAGIHDFVAAAHHIWELPYGRIADRNQLGLVLSEGRGTCSTKHALLAELARARASYRRSAFRVTPLRLASSPMVMRPR